MKFGIFSKYGALNSRPVFDALIESIKRKGWQTSEHDESADVAVIWSVLWDGRMRSNQQIYHKFAKNKKPIMILEIGALDRGRLWKVSIGGINGKGYFGPTLNNTTRREKLGIYLTPWRSGSDIILCGQHPLSQQWENMPPMNLWMNETIKAIRKYTDRKIIVRPHPRAKHVPTEKFQNVEIISPQHLSNTYDSFDFDKALNNAWAVINWSSNPAVVATLRGIPVFVGPESMAKAVGNLDLADIENPVMPCREQWANDLAYTEWSVDEIRNGEPLDRLTEKLTSYF